MQRRVEQFDGVAHIYVFSDLAIGLGLLQSGTAVDDPWLDELAEQVAGELWVTLRR